ncbi:ShlB/FhaC/HecB family hemolysin secretion/activation protein [Burkholderia sp. BE17]|uniref:ShlB/FhaC/HecB family hemolysin secretion/activation protein n=1 Tax=Burkholderia sp. BE17 TaxID=2656644 RepID=UPI00187B26FD|nr:ShlB/FhaC/HecB family hemolysin secretion/activation protein [Burkholderia sp. BE17]
MAAYRRELIAQGPIAVEAGSSVARMPELVAQLEPMLGKTIDGVTLKALTERTIAYVNSHSKGLNDVYLPPQTAADGVLIIVIKPATVGQVVAKGQRFVTAHDLTCHIRQHHGERLDTGVVADDLAYLNRNPWRRTDVAFTPGKVPGETDVVLNTTDERPLRAFVGYDNAGTRLTGLARYRAGFNWGNPFGLFDHRIDFNYAQAANVDRFAQATLSYTMPLPLAHRDMLSAYVGWSRTHVPLEDGAFDSRGTNYLAGIEWSHPLGIDPASPGGNLPEVYGGLEYKRIGSTLAFGEIPISDVVPEVFQGYVGYRGGWSDSWGHNDIDGRLTFSPGHTFSGNTDDIFNQSRPGAPSRYARVNLTYDRYVPLPAKWQFHMQLSGQYTNQPMLSSEQLSLTGASHVRGYYEDTLLADRGVVANFEVQTPYVQVPIGSTTGLLQGLAFFDVGRAWNKTPVMNADLERTGTAFSVASYGIGARFNLNPYLTVRSDLGWRTSPIAGKRGVLADVSVTLAY